MGTVPLHSMLLAAWIWKALDLQIMGTASHLSHEVWLSGIHTEGTLQSIRKIEIGRLVSANLSSSKASTYTS